jgi:hypothetical protein
MVCLSTLATFIAVDSLLYARVLKIGKAHDLPVIPYHDKIITNEGYLTGVHEKLFSAKQFSAGQISGYEEDSGFYESRWMKVETDENGLRNPIGHYKKYQDVILMGDSFTFGYGSDQNHIWSYILSDHSKMNIYNIGVYGAGPSQQVELLYYLTEEKRIKLSDSPIFVLLIFEGNDFNDFNVYRRKKRKKPFKQFYKNYRDRSILASISNIIKSFHRKKETQPYIILDSNYLGKVGFNNYYIEQIRKNNQTRETAKAVFEQSGIGNSFQRLNSLSGIYKAKIVIFYIPTKSRLYRKYFPGLPEFNEHDYMKELTILSANENDFTFIDLTSIFSEYAERGILLYWRDDTHLNNQGHKLLADITIDTIKSKDLTRGKALLDWRK